MTDGELKRVEIEGQPSKPWQLWRVHDGQKISKVIEGDFRDDLAKHKRRLDWHYQIFHKGKPIT